MLWRRNEEGNASQRVTGNDDWRVEGGTEEEMKRMWDDRMRQEKKRTPHDGGPERPSAALPDWHTIAALLPGHLPEFGETAQGAPTASRQIHLFIQPKWQVGIHRKTDAHRHMVRKKSKVFFVCHVRAISESKAGEICIHWSAAGKRG